MSPDSTIPITQHIAKITSTRLGTEDHNVFTAMLFVDYGGSGQGIGGLSLDAPRWQLADGRIVTARPGLNDGGRDATFAGRVGTAYGMEFIARVIRACGVNKWEDVKGRTVFVLKADDSWGGAVLGIQNLPTEPGERFLFDDLVAETGSVS